MLRTITYAVTMVLASCTHEAFLQESSFARLGPLSQEKKGKTT